MGGVLFYLTPWGLAYAIFRPRNVYGHADDAVDSWSAWQRGLSLALFVGLVWRFDPAAFSNAPRVAVFSVAQGAVCTVAVVLMLCVVSPLIVKGGMRWRAVLSCLRPVLRLMLFALFIYVLLRFGVIDYQGGGTIGGTTRVRTDDPWFIPKVLVGLAGAVWVSLFLLVSMYFVAARQLLIEDAHPALQPVAALAVSWILFLGTRLELLQSLTWGREGAPVFPQPPTLMPDNEWSLPITIVGLVGVTSVAVIDFIRTNSRHPLVTGPWR